jgi:hypothetical protein
LRFFIGIINVFRVHGLAGVIPECNKMFFLERYSYGTTLGPYTAKETFYLQDLGLSEIN